MTDSPETPDTPDLSDDEIQDQRVVDDDVENAPEDDDLDAYEEDEAPTEE